MEQIKEFEIGINTANKMYYIDSNVLLAMTQFYYKGKCNREEVTEEIKNFIIKASFQGWIQNQYALIETCYDYMSNSINLEQMNKIMIAYDNLILNMSPKEIWYYKGTNAPQAKRNSQRKYDFKSIFGCKLPQFFFNYEKDQNAIYIFYLTYLYVLKIYSLYFEKTSPIKKVESLFYFMTEEIDIFFGYEFLLGVALFIGDQKENEIIGGVVKPIQKPTLDHVLNSVIDIFQYRMICTISKESGKSEKPINPIFVTMDKPLQRYIEHWKNFNVLISSNAITSQDYSRLSVRDAYKGIWNDFYQNKYIPCIKNRNIECHVNGIGDEKMEKIIEKTRENIEKYEKTILRQY